ncbi:hypothetical protein BTO08_22315 (plasmid) [Photobacterium angustum]|uniref:Uncharacterized protein n=2 Tax=Photobacterium angustum TaxID=661 RepID=A0A2S7V8F8_PHOAN|nr:hypothetical protein BTO08_22315 [Photobacterium angustum]
MNQFHLVDYWSLNKDPNTELEEFYSSEFSPKRKNSKYRSKLSTLLANLIQASKSNSAVIYGRASKDCQMTVKLVDWLIGTGKAEGVKGVRSSFTKQSSIVWLSSQFVLELKAKKISTHLDIDKDFIILRDEQKNKVPFKKSKRTKELNKAAALHNKLWLQSEAFFGDGSAVIPFVCRIFNGDFKHGGRFYFYSQTEKKEKRANILIDGEPTVELDYKSLHFHLLYALESYQLENDPYLVSGYDRKVIKLAMLSFINSEDRGAWCANITRSGNPNFIKKVLAWKKSNTRKGVSWSDGVVEGIPLGTQGKDLAYAIDLTHHPIQHLFHTPKIGLTLQNKDSQIMATCLTELALLGIPTLPYHDGIRCPLSKVEVVKKVMQEAYKKEVGFNIQVCEA